MNFLKLTKDKLDLEAIQTLVLDETCGAISIFIGITRDHFENKKVIMTQSTCYIIYDRESNHLFSHYFSSLRSYVPACPSICLF